MSKRDKRQPRNAALIRAWEQLSGLAPREIREGRCPVMVVTGNPLDGTMVLGWHPAYGDVEDKVLLLTELIRMVRTGKSCPLDYNDNQEAQ